MKGVIRPKMTQLPASAEIPAGNLRSAPARHTHRLSVAQPYYYKADAAREAAGTFAAGTRVSQLSTKGALSRVVDDRGLSVYTASAGLEALPQSRSTSRKK
jgi:hypothetical protein